MIRYYFDEHVGHAVAEGLRREGIDVLMSVEAGMRGADDEDHVALARGQRRVIVTQDKDFLRMDAQGVDHAGIVYAPQGCPIGSMVQGLVLIAQVIEAEEMRGRVEYI